MKLQTTIRAHKFDPVSLYITKHYPEREANSLVKQYIQMWMASWSTANQTIKDTGNTDRTFGYNNYVSCAAGAATTTSGIQIGSNNTAVAISDYKLNTQITTNVTHFISTVGFEKPSTTSYRVVLTRGFHNLSGATLAIEEVGLVGYSPSGWNFLLDRTLLQASVEDNEGIQITYLLTLAFA